MADPLDEHPIHQVPLSMRYPATSDRNVYDRCIHQAFDPATGDLLLTGLGVYPNLGVIDAFGVFRRGGGDRTVAVRASGALGPDRLSQRVGPFAIEVVEPLRRIRLTCDGDEHGLGFDVTFTGRFPPIDEPHHLYRSNGRVILDACRFAQIGEALGAVRVDGTTLDAGGWVATRDRSWGIRPVGGPEAPGRPPDPGAEGGFHWCWSPMRFDDFGLMVILQEEADGHRILNEAVRVWPEETGRPPEQLGWPELEVRYRSGTRLPESATIHLSERGRRPLTLELELSTHQSLSVGAGYGGDPDWTHGQWMGREWVGGAVYDDADPAVAGRVPFTVVEHVARVTCGDLVGHGIFEHASIGRHDPSGFATWSDVAP